jgi:hypothetical protein
VVEPEAELPWLRNIIASGLLEIKQGLEKKLEQRA